MSDKLMDTASQLQSKLKDSAQFADLKAAFEKIKADPDTFKLFTAFQKLQLQLQQQQMQGQQPAETDIKRAQDMANQVKENESISNLMTKEKALNDLLNDVNRVVTQPIIDLYRD
ncbi:YlbF family regulator [Lentilactobacillus hilgardii]|uniref:YlbF family regulator n=1 Tax=Lentilactobacillus hilgardii TaxID=1588 RepID=UPI0039ECD293